MDMKTTITILAFIILFSFKAEAAGWPFGNKTTHNSRHAMRVEQRRNAKQLKRQERNAERCARRAKHFQKKKSFIKLDKKTKIIIRHGGKNKLFSKFRL